MGHIFWSFDLILHFCGQMPFGTIIQNNFTISHPFGMNPLHFNGILCLILSSRKACFSHARCRITKKSVGLVGGLAGFVSLLDL